MVADYRVEWFNAPDDVLREYIYLYRDAEMRLRTGDTNPSLIKKLIKIVNVVDPWFDEKEGCANKAALVHAARTAGFDPCTGFAGGCTYRTVEMGHGNSPKLYMITTSMYVVGSNGANLKPIKKLFTGVLAPSSEEIKRCQIS